jgi:MFS family permease
MDLTALPPVLANKIYWRIGPLIVLMYMASQLDRINIGYAALTMNAELRMTTAQFGLVSGIFFTAYILFEIPSNLSLHRLGARIWIPVILLGWGLLSSLTSIVPDVKWLYMARFFLGAFEAGLFPGIVYLLTLWMPARNRVWMMSLLIAAGPLTGMIGAPISTWLMVHAKLFEMSGWRVMVLLEGAPSILLSLVVYACLPNSPLTAPWLSSPEKAVITASMAQERASATTDDATGGIWSVLTNPKVWALGAVFFGNNSGASCLFYFLPQVVRTLSSGYSIADIGLITSVPFATAAVSALVWGRLVSRHEIRAIHVAGPLLVAAVFLSVALLLKSPFQTIIALSIGASACFCSGTTFWQLPTRLLAGRAAAAGIALITSLGVSAAAVMPYVIGWIKDATGGFQLSLLAIAATMVVSAAIALLLEAKARTLRDVSNCA